MNVKKAKALRKEVGGQKEPRQYGAIRTKKFYQGKAYEQLTIVNMPGSPRAKYQAAKKAG
jgi:hypothetical protein